MRYAIIGATLSGNKGAAAMLESSIQHLSKGDPNADFDVLTIYPESDNLLNSFSNVRILDASPLRLGVLINGAALAHRMLPPFRQLIEDKVPEVGAIAEADVLLDEGGITFVDGRSKFLIYNVATILPALFLRTPVFKIAQAMGSFREFLNRFAAKALLPKMAAIIARGDVTEGYLRELGLHNVRRGADLAFALEISDADVQSLGQKVDVTFFDAARVIGFSPSVVLAKSAIGSGIDYVGDTVRTIDYITDELGLPVCLVPHSVRIGTEKTHNNDLPLCRDIYARLASPQKVLFVDEELNPRELRHLIGQCHAFVASRFHAMVSALAQGVPTMVIGWSHKYGEVLADFGQEDVAVSLAEANPERVNILLDRILSDNQAIRDQLSNAFPAVRKQALEQISLVLAGVRR